MLAGAPYLRNLAALVLLGTVAAAFADYAFKVQAVQAFGKGDSLLLSLLSLHEDERNG